MDFTRRTHRLDRDEYQGVVCCAFTCCVQDKQPLFVTSDMFKVFEEKLRGALKKNESDAHVYLFMPDHVHLLLEGRSESSDLWKVIVDFKQATGYWLRSAVRSEKWQHDFYDHILRDEEDDVEKQVRYILENPVRAGIVEDWMSYPYKSSTIYDFSTW